MSIKSLEGYGVDAYLYLPVLGVACENLPQRVVRSPGNLDSNLMKEEGVLDGEGYDVGGWEGDDYWMDGRKRNDDFFQDSVVTRRSEKAVSALNERAL